MLFTKEKASCGGDFPLPKGGEAAGAPLGKCSGHFKSTEPGSSRRTELVTCAGLSLEVMAAVKRGKKSRISEDSQLLPGNSPFLALLPIQLQLQLFKRRMEQT